MSIFNIFSPFKGNKQKKIGRRKRNKITMRPYQIDAINSAIHAMVAKGQSFLLCLPAQTGKTFTFYSIVKKTNFTTLFVTPRKFITEQGASEAEEMFHKDEVGYINQSVSDVVMKRTGRSKLKDAIDGKKIVVADLETVINRIENNPSMFKYFELLGIDEAHYKADRVAYLRSLLKNAYHLGITATPYNGKGEYIDGWDVRFDKYDTQYMVKNGYLARVIRYQADIYSDTQAYTKYLAECRANKMSENGISDKSKEVGKIVTEKIIEHNLKEKIVNKKDRALVYAGSIEQSERIVEAYRAKGINAVCVHSQVDSSSERINAFNDGKYSVLVSVSMLIMGVVVKNVKNSVFFRDIGSYVTLIQINNRGRGGSPEMTRIPNKQYWYVPTIVKMGDPDKFQPFEKGEVMITSKPCCIECGALTSEYPMLIKDEVVADNFKKVIKECSLCGAESESDFSMNEDKLYDGTIRLVPIEQIEVVEKKIRAKKALNQVEKMVNEICSVIIEKKVAPRHQGKLIKYFKDNGVRNSMKDGEYLYKVLRMVNSNNAKSIETKIVKYLS